MALKEKLWMGALIGAILALAGAFLPYMGIDIMGMNMYLWLMGILMGTIVAMMYGSSFLFVIDPMLMTLFILLVVFSIIGLVGAFMGKKRTDLKLPGILWIVAGIVALVVMFVPIAQLGAGYFGFVPLHVGFFLPLIGGILLIIAGIAAFLVK